MDEEVKEPPKTRRKLEDSLHQHQEFVPSVNAKPDIPKEFLEPLQPIHTRERAESQLGPFKNRPKSIARKK
jgi:hypothetical protein